MAAPQTGPTLDADDRADLDAILDRLAPLEGPLLPILHDVQSRYGHVPEDALRIIAERLNLSRADVHGVASFYHDFRRQPAGRHVVKVCRAEACQSVGSDALSERAARKLGIAFGETTPDGAVTLEAVYCLGLCAAGPAAMIDGHVVGRLTGETLDAIIERCSRERLA